MSNLEVIILILFLIVLIVALCIIFNKQKDSLCVNPDICQGTKDLEAILEYDYKTEPNNPYYTSRMVVPRTNGGQENVKVEYLNKANEVYDDIENDLLNAAQVPKQGQMFLYP